MTLSIATVLMGALGSVFILAARALPTRQPTLTAPAYAARAVERIAQDVVYATSVPAGSATSLTLTLPDRNADAIDESVTFSWDGRAGSPLIRTLNGSPAETLLTNVRALSFGYRLRSAVSTSTGPAGTGSEQTWLNIAASNTTYTNVTSNASFAQTVRPTLPGGTTSWSVSRVTLMLKPTSQATGQFSVQIRTVASDGKPTSTILGQATVLESSITGTQQTYTLSGASNFTAADSAAVCLVYKSGANACSAAINLSQSSPAGSGYYTSSNSGGTWSAQDPGTLVCTVYGYATSPTSIQAISTALDRVTISVQAGDDAAPTVYCAATPLNRPAVSP